MDPATLPILVMGVLVILLVGFILYKEFHFHLMQKHFQVQNDQQGLLALISSITDGIIMIDNQFHLVVYNPATVQLLNILKIVQDPHKKLSFEDILIAIGTRVNLKTAIDQALATSSVIKLPEFEIGGRVLQTDVE